MTEKLNPEAYRIALLEQIQKSMAVMNKNVQSMRAEMRSFQEKSDVHLRYPVDLSVAHDDYEIADFTNSDFDVNSIIILPLPSDMSIKLRGRTDEPMILEENHSLNLDNVSITRLLVTNIADAGTAEIHIYGKRRVKLL